MKYINFLSLMFLLAPAVITCNSGNPELYFIFAAQAIDGLKNSITEGNENNIAKNLIVSMNNLIDFDAQQQKAIAASQSSFFSKGKTLNINEMNDSINKLKADIKKYNSDIKALEGSNKTLAPINKSKINDRKKSRAQKQEQLEQQIASENDFEKAQNLVAQNRLDFEHALESYITAFGQCYTVPGSLYGSSIIISSKHDKKLAITTSEFKDLINMLNKAANQFGSNVQVTLALENTAPVKISDIVTFMNNMNPSLASYASYAAVGGVILAIGAEAIHRTVNK